MSGTYMHMPRSASVAPATNTSSRIAHGTKGIRRSESLGAKIISGKRRAEIVPNLATPVARMVG